MEEPGSGLVVFLDGGGCGLRRERRCLAFVLGWLWLGLCTAGSSCAECLLEHGLECAGALLLCCVMGLPGGV
jgi:hypothetical protein